MSNEIADERFKNNIQDTIKRIFKVYYQKTCYILYKSTGC